MKCPSCGASVPAGETICLDCGTELVFGVIDDAPAQAPAREPEPVTAAEPAGREVSCPDCSERVTPDANGLCPICGHDFGGFVEIDEDEFFKDPPSLEEAMEAERQRLLQLQADAGAQARSSTGAPVFTSGGSSGTTGGMAGGAPSAADAAPQPPGEMPLPGDRHRTRYRTGAQPAAASEAAWLIVEGGQSVFFDGRMTAQIRLDVDQILIGRRDPAEGHYPDVDLGHFRHIDGHISRRHARVYRQQGRWYLEDLCENDATYLNDKAHVINGETVPLKEGDRVLVSDSVAMTFRLQGP